MKTPEEIKKGLGMCSVFRGRCEGCPYEGNTRCICEKSTDGLAYIQQLEAQVPKWISVEERLPKEHERVLVAIRLDNGLSIHTTGFAGGEWLVTLGDCEHVTHWMPLPEPPKER